MFTFGVDAEEVDQLREDRKNFKDYDPRWKEAFKYIYDGKFGDKEYFKVPNPASPFSHAEHVWLARHAAVSHAQAQPFWVRYRHVDIQ